MIIDSMSESPQEIGMSKRITDYRVLRETIPGAVKDSSIAPTSWLDTGCGMGGSIRLSVERFPDTRFTLSDPSEDNISEARRSYRDRCDYIVSTSDRLDLEDSSFDVITAILSHHYYSDRETKLLATVNCHRMLKDGGIFVVVEHTRYDGDQAAMDSQWEKYMRDSGLEEESIRQMFARRDTVYFPYTEEEYVQLLKDAGFSEIKPFWRTCSDIGFVARKRIH
jgi:tRNA (cmo5U34)-methyltransferase